MTLVLFVNQKGLFRIYKLISKGNPAQFHSKMAKWVLGIDNLFFMHNILSKIEVGKGGNYLKHPVGGLADSRVFRSAAAGYDDDEVCVANCRGLCTQTLTSFAS